MSDQTLGVLAPIEITDARFISSTVAETDYAAYNSGTTYAAGTRVISATTHRIYESLQSANTNHDPTDINNRVGTAPWWLDVDPTNQRAMFDGEVSTQTEGASPLTAVLEPGFFNAIYLAGMEGDELEITVKDTTGGNVIYHYDGALEASMPDDYYDYFFSPFKPLTDFLASGIDPYNAAEVTIEVRRATGDAKIGMAALGDLKPLGKTLYGAKAKPKTFSYIKVDEFGKNKIVRRKSAKDITLTVWLELAEANTVIDTITSLLDMPCVWIGADQADYAGLRAFGLGSGEVSFDYPQDCMLTVDVKGLI